MKEQIYKICTQLNDGQIAVTEATEQLLDLFVVSGSALHDKVVNEVIDKALTIPAVVGRSEQFKCRNVACNEMVSVDSDDVFCEKHKRRLGI